MTIVDGTNGLGKSNLFDALEWALTGSIERLELSGGTEKEKRQALTRATADPSDTRVCLEFKGARIERKLTGAQPDDEFVLSKLLAPNWKLEKLSTYLAFTHFLGQSSKRLWVHKKEADRWTYLGGPSRLEQLWALKRKLGPALTGELKRVVHDAQDALDLARQRRAQWTEQYDEHKALAELARAGDRIGPNQVVSACETLRIQLKSVFDVEPSSSLPAAEGTPPEQALVNTARIIEAAEGIWSARIAALQQQAESLDRWHRIAAEVAERERQASDLTCSLRLAETVVQQIESEKSAARATVDETLAKLASAHAHLRRLQDLRSASLRVDELRHRQDELVTRLEDCVQQRHRAAEAVQSIELRVEHAQAAAAALSHALFRSQRLARLRRQVQALREAQDRKEASAQAWRDAEPRLSALRERLTETLNQIRATAQLRNSLLEQLNDARRRTESVRAAVAAIAAALADDARQCPVCRATHDDGRLKERALLAAREDGEALAVLEQNLRQTDANLSALRALQDGLQCEVEDHAKFEQDRVAAAREHLRQREALRAVPELLDVPEDQFLVYLEQLDAQVNAELSAAQAASKAHGSEEQLRAPLLRSKAELSRAQATEGALRSQVEGIAREMRDRLDLIDCLVRELSLPSDWSQQLASRLSSAAEVAGKIQAALDGAKRRLELTDARDVRESAALQHLRVTLDAVGASLDAGRAQTDALEKDWRQADLGDRPSFDSLHRAMNEAQSRQSELARLRDEHRKLTEGLSGWRSEARLQRLSANLMQWRGSLGVASNEEAAERLQSDIRDAEARLQRLKDFDGSRETVLETLGERIDLIQERTLKPLNVTFEAFNRALSTAPHQVRLECRFGRGATTLIRVHLSDAEVNPDLYLSEGQLAALNLCMLFSASVTYPWSRWPALLLDDPLQHNDVIHASAFMDVLCNLVREKHYQVVLSTHDSAEADYFLRKCKSSGIKTQTCHLTAVTENGVEYQTEW